MTSSNEGDSHMHLNQSRLADITSWRAEVQKQPNQARVPLVGLLALRIITMTLLTVMLTKHVRSLRVFRWEQSVTGGLLVTYCTAMLGLTLCTGTDRCRGMVLQVYFCGFGIVLFTINAAVLWRRWKTAADLTRVVAELLMSLGVRVRRQILYKVWLSLATALALLIDLAIIPLIGTNEVKAKPASP